MQARPSYEEIQRQESLRTANVVRAAATSIDLADLAAIFFMLSKEVLKVIYEQIAKYFLMPLAVVANIINMIFAWRQAHLNNYEGHSVAHAVIETIGAAAITTAVVGALVFTALFAVVAPAMFAATFLMKATYNVVNAVYFGVKAARESDPVKQAEYSNKSKESTIGAVVGVFGAIAVIGVMLLGKTALTVVGITIGVIGAAIMIGKALHEAFKRPQQEAIAAVEAEENGDAPRRELSQGARVAQALGATRQANVSEEKQRLLDHDEHSEVSNVVSFPHPTQVIDAQLKEEVQEKRAGNGLH